MKIDIGQESSYNVIMNYYIKNVSKEDFRDFFTIYKSDNIIQDIISYENDAPDGNTSGIVLFPDTEEKVIVLIDEKALTNTYIHELTHVYDFYSFAKHFSLKTNKSIKNHPCYKALNLWSEYHSVSVEIVHNQFIAYHAKNMNFEKRYTFLQSDIQNMIYGQIICNFPTGKITYHDIMWLFAGIDICNKYDVSHTYGVPNYILKRIPKKYFIIHRLIQNVLDFENLLPILQDLQSVA